MEKETEFEKGWKDAEKEKEFNLSEKAGRGFGQGNQRAYMEENIKEFIKRFKQCINLEIKENIKSDTERAGHEWRVLNRIRLELDKLAGEKLT